MEDELDASDGVVDALVAAQLALDDLDVVLEAGEVRAVAGGEVVEDPNRVAALEELANEVRADEAAAAGDEDLTAHAVAPGHSARCYRQAEGQPEESVDRDAGEEAESRQLRRGDDEPEQRHERLRRPAPVAGERRSTLPAANNAEQREQPRQAEVGGGLDERVLHAPWVLG